MDLVKPDIEDLQTLVPLVITHAGENSCQMKINYKSGEAKIFTFLLLELSDFWLLRFLYFTNANFNPGKSGSKV